MIYRLSLFAINYSLLTNHYSRITIKFAPDKQTTMKRKIISALITIFLFNLSLKADEGMWLPMLLGQQVYDDMVKKGLKLTKEQLYDINKASIKDAIIIFGGGCTGEIVSNEGLIF